MQPASAEQPWGFQANGEPGIFVHCCFVSHLKVLKAFLFLLCFVSASFCEPEVCQALTPASTTLQSGFVGMKTTAPFPSMGISSCAEWEKKAEQESIQM